MTAVGTLRRVVLAPLVVSSLAGGCISIQPDVIDKTRPDCRAPDDYDPISCAVWAEEQGCQGFVAEILSDQPTNCEGLQCEPPSCPASPFPAVAPRDELAPRPAPAAGGSRRGEATAAVVAALPSSERAALVALYEATGGPTYWYRRDNWLGPAGSECSWYGVRCSADGAHVVALGFDRNGLAGTLPKQLGELTALELLAIHDAESLGGTIPAELGKLKKLQLLSLERTGLSGSVPSALGGLSALRGLRIASSEISGSLPATLGNLTQLQLLQISASRVSGAIPAALGNLAQLRVLDLRLNELSGAIPGDLGRLTNLTTLLLGWNDLTGAIPPSLGGLPKLRLINLERNRLSGSIPTSLGTAPSLELLTLDANRLSGPLPDSFAGATKLRNLSVGFNAISGALPAWVANLGALRILYLPKNQLGGALPDLSALHELTDLHLAWNDFDPGPLPAWLAAPALGKLAKLDLSKTRRTGPLADLGSLPLTHLALGENAFDAGPVPPWLFAETSLQHLDLRAAGRTGPIPDGFAALDQLQALVLSDNPFTPGPIPAFFNDTDLPRLANLTLDGTQRTGKLPKALFTLPLSTLRLARNQLAGKIPKEIKDPLIGILDLSENQLSGALPTELGTQIRMQSLRLNGNQLSGEIPAFYKSSLIDEDMIDGVVEDPFGREFPGIDLRHNMLKTSDPEMLALLQQKHEDGADFRATQTVAPTGLKATALAKDQIKLTWTAIAFKSGGGGYRIEKASKASGPWTAAGNTANKAATSFTVTGLKAATEYYFRVRSTTPAHAGNPNALTSAPTPVVKAKTKP